MTKTRQFAVYFCWSRPQEVDVELGVLENRFPTLFEFRRAIWPLYEWASDPGKYTQDVSGFLDHVVLFDFQDFHNEIEQATGNAPQVIQRVDDQPPVRELDDDLLRGVDTLIMVSLDHQRTVQQVTTAELDCLNNWLQGEDKCLVICPHHDIGSTPGIEARKEEFFHHGDRQVPAQQRFGGFARSLFQGLGLPVENQFGLSPADAEGSPAPLSIDHDADRRNLLQGVGTFNLHPHLPHLAIVRGVGKTLQNDTAVHVLARQKINPHAAPHPFTSDGNTEFNAFAWAPASGNRGAEIYICDATLWSGAFGGNSSLGQLWRNFAAM